MHKASGYLPITKAAYAKTKESGYYKENPYLETPLLELTNKEPTENSRGLRLGNMVQLRDVWAEEIEAALAGKKTAQGGARRGGGARQRHAAPVRDRRRVSKAGSMRRLNRFGALPGLIRRIHPAQTMACPGSMPRA